MILPLLSISYIKIRLASTVRSAWTYRTSKKTKNEGEKAQNRFWKLSLARGGAIVETLRPVQYSQGIVLILEVLCPFVTCVHGKPAQTPSTESTLQYNTHSCTETFPYTSWEPYEKGPHYTIYSGSIEGFRCQKGFDEDRKAFVVLLKYEVFWGF